MAELLSSYLIKNAVKLPSVKDLKFPFLRRQLQAPQISLAGLYDGNPRRTTARPTAERLLAAFCGITLYFHPDESWEITPVSPLQKQILQLMGMGESIYSLPERYNLTQPTPP